MTDRIAAVKSYLLDLQDRICAALEAEDGKARFAEGAWERPAGGGGGTRGNGEGALSEKEGVEF
ncbi:coproporphyrinogen III oxidase, partial [Pseudomonas aeruginosa]|uniref:coproporphyrinogen III oxidase n=1 Tax=Pseudomonas aeruginosa TaxID=287 RepID=UPI002E8E66B1|nr:coproporphyrinogen III oxidase [Pseudomonas aeruginosa]